MSKKTTERHNAKVEYFNYLRETAEEVDPVVKAFLERKASKESLDRYRFGKPQLRPALVRIGYELAGGKDFRQILPACGAVEVKDTGYYCLDDFFDIERKPSLVYQGLELIFLANDLIEKTKGNKDLVRRAEKQLRALDLDNLEGLFIDLSLKDPNPERYLQKARHYNFWEHTFKIGGILANSSEQTLEILGEIGRNIGTGYIVANDTWDFGKDLEDFRSGKYTLPVIYAFENSPQKDLLKSLFKKELTPEEIETVRKLIVSSGAIEGGKRVAKEFCDKGLSLLASFPESKAKRLIEFATTTTQRNKYYSVLDGLK